MQAWASLASPPNAAPTPESASSNTSSPGKGTTYAHTTALSAPPRNASPTPQCISFRTPLTLSVDTLTAGAQTPASPATVATSTNTSMMKPSTAPSRSTHRWYLCQTRHRPQRGALYGIWKTPMDLHAEVLCAHPLPTYHPRRNRTIQHPPYRPAGAMPCKPA